VPYVNGSSVTRRYASLFVSHLSTKDTNALACSNPATGVISLVLPFLHASGGR
jgi:hypothetical protein